MQLSISYIISFSLIVSLAIIGVLVPQIQELVDIVFVLVLSLVTIIHVTKLIGAFNPEGLEILNTHRLPFLGHARRWISRLTVMIYAIIIWWPFLFIWCLLLTIFVDFVDWKIGRLKKANDVYNETSLH